MSVGSWEFESPQPHKSPVFSGWTFFVFSHFLAKGAAIPILRMSTAHSCTLNPVFQPVRGQGCATECSARHTPAPSAGDQSIGLLYILVIITTFAVSPAQEHNITVY